MNSGDHNHIGGKRVDRLPVEAAVFRQRLKAEDAVMDRSFAPGDLIQEFGDDPPTHPLGIGVKLSYLVGQFRAIPETQRWPTYNFALMHCVSPFPSSPCRY